MRTATQLVVHEPERIGLAAAGELEYEAPIRHCDFAAFKRRMALVDAQRAAALAQHEHDLERSFRAAGEQASSGWSFLQLTRVTLLRRMS